MDTNMWKASPRFARPSDFCRLFLEEMNSLYLLAFLLMADQKMAEQCFASALNDCGSATGVFKSWAHTWARRAIVKNAIRVAQPSSDENRHLRRSRCGQSGVVENVSGAPLTAVLGLSTFERFVFVMTVLESYSDQDCRSLLGCLRKEVAEARTRALEHIGTSANQPLCREDFRIVPSFEVMAARNFG